MLHNAQARIARPLLEFVQNFDNGVRGFTPP